MKIQELKKWTRDFWEASCVVTDAIIQPENFAAAVSRFGDRRRKATWIKAFCHYATQTEYFGNLDAPSLGLIRLLGERRRPWFEYRNELLEAFLTFPQGPHYVLAGLQELRNWTEKEAEYCGISRLVEDAVQERGLSAQGAAPQLASGHRV